MTPMHCCWYKNCVGEESEVQTDTVLRYRGTDGNGTEVQKLTTVHQIYIYK